MRLISLAQRTRHAIVFGVTARHRPERTLFYQLIEQHFPAFGELRAEVGRPLPTFVQEEFEAFPVELATFQAHRFGDEQHTIAITTLE